MKTALTFIIAMFIGISIAQEILLFDTPETFANTGMWTVDTPEKLANTGMWTVGDIVRPVAGCWDGEDFKVVQDALMNRDTDQYIKLMESHDVKCIDLRITRAHSVPMILMKMTSHIEMPDLGLQLQFWEGRYGPEADGDAWLWIGIPYGVLKQHGKEIPEDAVLWPNSTAL